MSKSVIIDNIMTNNQTERTTEDHPRIDYKNMKIIGVKEFNRQQESPDNQSNGSSTMFKLRKNDSKRFHGLINRYNRSGHDDTLSSIDKTQNENSYIKKTDVS